MFLKLLILSCILPCWSAIPPEPLPGAHLESGLAGLDIVWKSERANATYRLEGRFAVRGLSNGVSLSVSNETDLDRVATHLDVPPGMYSLTLNDGFQVRRLPSNDDDTLGQALETEETVAASLLSPNPLIVIAQAGRSTATGLSLVARPAERPVGQLGCSDS